MKILKSDDDIKLSGIQLESTGNHRMSSFYESVDEWRTVKLPVNEYIVTGSDNKSSTRKVYNQNNVTFFDTRWNVIVFSRNGQYFIIKNTCKITNLLNTCKDQTEQTPFVEGIFNYNTGGWIFTAIMSGITSTIGKCCPLMAPGIIEVVQILVLALVNTITTGTC